MVTEDETDAIMKEIVVPVGETAKDEQVICILLHPKPGSSAEASSTKKKK